MDNASGQNALSLDQLKQFKDQYISLFQQWAMEMPKLLLQKIASSSEIQRIDVFRFLELRWRKLHQDLNGTLVLLHSNHIGSATALTRVVRENVLEMVVCAFDDPINDVANLHFLVDIRQKNNAEMLRKHCEAFKDIQGLNTAAQNRLASSMQYVKGVADDTDEYPTAKKSNLANNKGFRGLAKYNMQLLKEYEIEPDILVINVLDYWMECEAVHTGPNAIHHYEPTKYFGDIEKDAELSAISGIRDLYSTKALVTASLLVAGDIRGKVQIPEVAKQLGTIAERAEKLVATLTE